jgi:LemA protein
MKKGTIVLIVFLGLIIIGYVWFKNLHNSMVAKDEAAKSTWADVQSAYQRRLDLIPNLVSTVKGAANFEQSTLTAVVEARAKATSVNIDPSHMSKESLQQFQAAQNQVGSSLHSMLNVIVEQYPDIKATQNFRDLQAQLEGTENRINFARNNFNGAVQDYNSYIKSFPQNMFASGWGYTERPYFAADSGASKAPSVKF